MYETIRLDHRGRVSTVTLDRPPLNLVTAGMLAELADAFDALDARAETRAVVLTGAGKRAFSAGADIRRGEMGSEEESRALRQAGRAIIARIETFPKPVVAAVRGWCIGGGTGFAWCCDIRLAAESARFRAGDVYLGIVPTWSVGMVRLVHYIGRNRTLDLLLLGEDIDAGRALELGIVSRVVPDAALADEAMRVATRLAEGAPLAIRAIKEAVRCQAVEGPGRAAELEEAWCRRVFASADAAEGMAAFLEKRKPEFRGE